MTREQERLTRGEMEMVMSTFKQYEVSLRGACIDVKDLLPALVSLGLNMMEQEVTDTDRHTQILPDPKSHTRTHIDTLRQFQTPKPVPRVLCCPLIFILRFLCDVMREQNKRIIIPDGSLPPTSSLID